MCRRSHAALAAVLVLWWSPAGADSLSDARKAIEGSDYLTARPALETALKAGTAGPDELAEIYKLTGIVEAALGNADAAQAAFARWLALEPKGSLPAGTSPKITRPFTAAQEQQAKQQPVAVKAETADEPPAVTLVIANDPWKMIVAARVHFAVDKKAEQTLEAEGKQKITIELERGKRIDLRLHALDKYGNRVVELGSKDVPIVITSSGKEKPIVDPKLPRKREPAEPETPRPLVLQWWLWGSAAVVATGFGAYFGWRTQDDVQRLDYLNANSLAHSWSEAQEVEASARRNLLVTNIAAGTAGAFAIGAIVLYVTRPRLVESARTAIAPVPVPGGGALVLGGRF